MRGCYDSGVRGKPVIYQYVKVTGSILLALVFTVAILETSAGIQLPKPSLPDPVKFLTKRDIVMRASRSVFEQLGYKIELEDPSGGRLVTRPYEFVSGAITTSEIDKIAIKSDDSFTGAWLKARYTVEGIFESVSSTQTLVTIRTKMEALNRDSDGAEKWLPLQSLGSVEKRVLGKISLKLLGTEPEYKDRKGFWEKKPTAVPPIKKQPSF
jgi:hypothetical protein